MKKVTICTLKLSKPWDNYSVKFHTGVSLDLHKCPHCTGFMVGFDFLGFGAHFTFQRGKVELMGQKNEA